MSPTTPAAALPPDQPGVLAGPDVVDEWDFEGGYGEPLARTLDLDTWTDGRDFGAAFARLDEEVRQALVQEDELAGAARRVLFPVIQSRPSAPRGAGVYQATRRELESAQRNVLFNGGVEACDATSSRHDTLALTITQVGVCLVSYQGEQGAWGHRLFRRDLRLRGPDPVEEALELLQRRELRAGMDQEGERDQLSEFARRGIMTYAERAVLFHKATVPWRMGHGQPAPYELLTGHGGMEFLRRSLELLRRFLLEHKRFVYVPSAPGERLLLTVGQYLRPLEFAVVDTYEHRLAQILTKGRLGGEYRELAEAFAREAGPDILLGVYRTYAESPPQVFYAHADFVEEAALIAMADSLLQPHRAFPTLIDLADNVCASVFGGRGLHAAVRSAYARHGRPLRYLSERETRR
jgi:hypothetical protein